MEKRVVNYKKNILIIYTIVCVVIILLFYYALFISNKIDVSNISYANISNKFKDKINTLDIFFEDYENGIQALATDKGLINYLNDTNNSNDVLNSFLALKKTLGCLFEIEYIDKGGMEKLKVEGTAVRLFGEKAISKVVPFDKLENKIDAPYVKKFLSLEKNQIAYSPIDLHITNGKIDIPKKPVIKIGTKVFDSNGTQRGIIVFNICLKAFWGYIDNSILYDILFIDNKGRFLKHSDPQIGLTGQNFDEYLVYEEFGEKFGKEILQNDSISHENFYSNKVLHFHNEQDIKMILKQKYVQLSKDAKETQKIFIFLLLITVILCTPFILYFSKLPELLKEKIEDQIRQIKEKDEYILLQAKEAALGEMIDSIAHQWKSPLSVIKMLAQTNVIEYEINNSLNQKAVLENSSKIEFQVDHLVETLDEFRNFLKPNEHKESISVESIINSIQVLMKDQLIQNTVELIVKGDTKNKINVVANEVKHIFINLIANSIDAFNQNNIKNNKLIIIEVKQINNFIDIEVYDNAGGIPKDIVNKVFEKRFTTKKKYQGSGMGLYMSKQIAHKNHASLRVVNKQFKIEDKNYKGAFFTLCFKNLP